MSCRMKLRRKFKPEGHLEKSESGSALLMGVLLIWMVVYSISMMGHVSTVVSNKMRAQMAADTAALSAARLLANNMSTMAWINDSRALLHYTRVKYGADLVSSGVLALMKARRPERSDSNGDDFWNDSISDEDLMSEDDGVAFIPQFDEVFENLTEIKVAPWESNEDHWSSPSEEERVVKGRSAEEHLARFQHHMAMITEVMLEKEIYDRAAENGSELTSYFPRASVYPAPGSYRELYVSSISQTLGPDGEIVDVAGWKYERPETNLSVTATYEGGDSWEIEAYMEDDYALINIGPMSGSDDLWEVDVIAEIRGDDEEYNVIIDTKNNLIIYDDGETKRKIKITYRDDGSVKVERWDGGSKIEPDLIYRVNNG